MHADPYIVGKLRPRAFKRYMVRYQGSSFAPSMQWLSKGERAVRQIYDGAATSLPHAAAFLAVDFSQVGINLKQFLLLLCRYMYVVHVL